MQPLETPHLALLSAYSAGLAALIGPHLLAQRRRAADAASAHPRLAGAGGLAFVGVVAAVGA